jgi:hypothetical protein
MVNFTYFTLASTALIASNEALSSVYFPRSNSKPMIDNFRGSKSKQFFNWNMFVNRRNNPGWKKPSYSGLKSFKDLDTPSIPAVRPNPVSWMPSYQRPDQTVPSMRPNPVNPNWNIAPKETSQPFMYAPVHGAPVGSNSFIRPQPDWEPAQQEILPMPNDLAKDVNPFAEARPEPESEPAQQDTLPMSNDLAEDVNPLPEDNANDIIVIQNDDDIDLSADVEEELDEVSDTLVSAEAAINNYLAEVEQISSQIDTLFNLDNLTGPEISQKIDNIINSVNMEFAVLEEQAGVLEEIEEDLEVEEELIEEETDEQLEDFLES